MSRHLQIKQENENNEEVVDLFHPATSENIKGFLGYCSIVV